jgi:transposase
LEKLLKRHLQQKRRRPVQRFCTSSTENAEAGDYLERSRVRLCHTCCVRGIRGVQKVFDRRRLDAHASPQATWMLLQPEKLNGEQRSIMEKLCRLFPRIDRKKELTKEFIRIVRARSLNQFNEWLRAAMRSKLKEFESFARGLSEDYEAVKNALRYGWSKGQLKGQVNRLKLIKRMMYGRGKFDLLRARVLHSM